VTSERVPFVPRVVSVALDGVFLLLLLVMVQAVASDPGTARIAVGVCILAYFSAELVAAASAGKLAMKFTIKSKQGAPAHPTALLIRYLLKVSPVILTTLALSAPALGWLRYLSGALTVLLVVGWILALGPRRQTLHDILSGTAVYGRDVA